MAYILLELGDYTTDSIKPTFAVYSISALYLKRSNQFCFKYFTSKRPFSNNSISSNAHCPQRWYIHSYMFYYIVILSIIYNMIQLNTVLQGRWPICLEHQHWFRCPNMLFRGKAYIPPLGTKWVIIEHNTYQILMPTILQGKAWDPYGRSKYRWLSARKTQLQCISNGVTSFLHLPIDIYFKYTWISARKT